jgi:hypothetical protein
MSDGCMTNNPRKDGGQQQFPNQVQAWRTPSVAEEKNQNTSKQIYLQNQVGAVQKRWPTPASSTGQGGAHGLGGGSGANATLKTIGMAEMGTGKLNPRWVETLMGLPVGWTMPSCACPVTIAPTNFAFSETESSQPPQNELFGS